MKSITVNDGNELTVKVGDTGKATATVTVDPDEDQYKQVEWFAVKAEGSDEPADNLIVTKSNGSWIAANSGTAYLKATSLKDDQVVGYQKVTIENEAGVTAINLTDADKRVNTLLEDKGINADSITHLKVFTNGKGKVTADDIAYIKTMSNLATLDMKNADIAELPASAFSGHQNLATIYLPDTLISIGQRSLL